MNLKECFLVRNDCYTSSPKITKVTGIVVHSTGANNKTVKRYVQPIPSQDRYAELMAELGENRYNNHWNKSHAAGEIDRESCVHAFIGINANGNIITCQTLPYDTCAWGVGKGVNGSYNYNPTARIQFEICEDGLSDRAYFEAAFKEAKEYCAYLCKKFGLSADDICSHKESCERGYGNNHGDPENWAGKFGVTMNDFRNDVRALLNSQNPAPASKPETPYAALKIGDEVSFTGSQHFTSANSGSAISCKPGRAKITAIYARGIHPYHVIRVPGTGATVYGWVNAADIIGASTQAVPSAPTAPAAPAAPEPVTIRIGDKVKCKTGVTKFSNGTNMAPWVRTAVLYVRGIEKNGTIYLVSTVPSGTSYTGRINSSDVGKV